jgi:hypothetical protein
MGLFRKLLSRIRIAQAKPIAVQKATWHLRSCVSGLEQMLHATYTAIRVV